MKLMRSRQVGQDNSHALSGDKVMIDDGERTWLASTTDAAPEIRKTSSVASRNDWVFQHPYLKGEIMAACEQSVWDSYKVDPAFRRYLEVCRNFDPEGFDRALKEDEDAHSFDFRSVIIAAYLEDSRARVVR